MTLPAGPKNQNDQLQWLVDRALIGDLIVEYARSADRKDWAGLVALYTEDGKFTIPGKFSHQGKAGFEEFVAGALQGFHATWHLTSNFHVELDGDSATVSYYTLGVHVLDALDPYAHGDGGVIYEALAVRTDEGWRFSSVTINEVWLTGEGVPGEGS